MKILSMVNKFEVVTQKLATYGLLLCNILLLIVFAATYINNDVLPHSISLNTNLLLFAEVVVATYAIIIIGCVIFDYNAKKHLVDK